MWDMKPIEFAPIFLKPRVRLRYQVTLSEMLELARTCKDDEKRYPAIEESAESLTEGSCRIFTQDIFDLSVLQLGLDSHQYSITVRGRRFLKDRLNTIYGDGMEFKVAAVFLRATMIKPIIKLAPRLVESEELALEATAMSRKIGAEVDIKLDGR